MLAHLNHDFAPATVEATLLPLDEPNVQNAVCTWSIIGVWCCYIGYLGVHCFISSFCARVLLQNTSVSNVTRGRWFKAHRSSSHSIDAKHQAMFCHFIPQMVAFIHSVVFYYIDRQCCYRCLHVQPLTEEESKLWAHISLVRIATHVEHNARSFRSHDQIPSFSNMNRNRFHARMIWSSTLLDARGNIA